MLLSAIPANDRPIDKLRGKLVKSLIVRTAAWLGVVFLAMVGIALATDRGFAVHMGIVAFAALFGLWVTVSRTDYGAIARGIIRTPADPARYDDDPIRWGVIATVFWGVVGFLAGLFIALQLAFPAAQPRARISTSGGCGRCTLRR